MKRSSLILLAIAVGAGLGIAAVRWTQSPPGGGTGIAVKLPDRFSQSATAGRDLFDANCKLCHGSNGAGTDQGPTLIHKLYEPNHHTDQAFYRAAQLGVRAHHWRFGNMPPVAGATRDDVGLIIRYVREIQRANGIY